MATLVYDPEKESREGFCGVLSSDLISRWSVQEQYIALVELAAPVTGVFQCSQTFQGRDVVWLMGNSAALACLVKGGSPSADMDGGFAAVHLALAFLHCRIWFEYVESDSNWSDTASRELFADRWSQDNQLTLSKATVPSWVWLVDHQDLLATVCSKLP